MSSPFEALRLKCRKLSVREYKVDMHIGVYDCEKQSTQPVVFTVDIWIPLHSHNLADLSDTYDYTEIVRSIDLLICSGHIELQEQVHEALFSLLFKNPSVVAANILTQKTKAYANASAATVETFRFNPLTPQFL